MLEVRRCGPLVLGLVLAVGGCHRSKAAKKPIASDGVLQALATANQPATAVASVKQAAQTGDGCRYAEVAARAALDADLHPLAQRILDAAPNRCARARILLGEKAETLARAGKTDQADTAASALLKTDPANPYAELALSRVAYDRNQMTVCAQHADAALKFGRGAEAERLLGRSTLARGQFKEADAHFKRVLQANPNDAEAAFTAAICQDKLGHYYEAREGFLQTLRIDPKHQQARFYLGVMAHKAGFNEEARHDLSKLAELAAKDDPELLELQQLLDAGTPDAGAPAPPSPPSAAVH
ncbi:MAG: tetratricopeptide repeat protein [Polyangiaceae bacterium]